MNYIKYIASKDGTNLYTKVNEVNSAKGNIIIVHGVAEHLDRYDELTNYLNHNGFNVIRYDQRGHGRSEGQQTFYSTANEIVDDLTAIINKVKSQFDGELYLIGHSMGGYTVTLFGTQYPGKVDGIVTSGALTRYNKETFGKIDKSADMHSYIENVLSDGLCSDETIVKKYALDDLNAKQISNGLLITLIEGVEYLKNNAQQFVDPILILHGKEDGLVSYKDSIQLFDEIGSEHKSIHIYDDLQHEIFNESSYNESIFREIVDWLNREIQRY